MKEMRELAKWSLALLEAWVAGDAPWLFENGQSVSVTAFLAGGLAAVIELATRHGITPKLYPPRAPQK